MVSQEIVLYQAYTTFCILFLWFQMKDICHIWELGGGTSLSKMVQIPITLENIELV